VNRPKKNGSISLQIPDDPGYLDVVRRTVRAAAARAGFAPLDVLKITMAVDEACVNIIEHGYRTLRSGPSGKPIRIHVSLDADRIRVSIQDAAPHFNPLDKQGASIDEYVHRGIAKGLGLTIIRKFVDTIEHSYQPGEGNTVHLVKFRPRP
jgi:serine/threonine-protein kinase RsbW